MGNVTLALHLLCERANPSSPWLPYIKTLPADYDTPLYFEEEEVRHLLATQAIQDVLSQYKNTARQYAYFYKVIHVSHSSSLSCLCACIYILLTHSFGLIFKLDSDKLKGSENHKQSYLSLNDYTSKKT